MDEQRAQSPITNQQSTTIQKSKIANHQSIASEIARGSIVTIRVADGIP
jgi:hypothetical protein